LKYVYLVAYFERARVRSRVLKKKQNLTFLQINLHTFLLDNFCATGSPPSTCSSDCDSANCADSVEGPSIQDIKDDSSSSVYFDSHLDAGFEDPFDDDCLNKSTPEFILGWAVPRLVWLTPNKDTDMADRSAAFWIMDEPGATLGFFSTVGQNRPT